MRLQMIFGVLALVAGLAARANAAEDIPDPGKQREFGAKLLVCNVCHGDRGTPKNPTVPIIWGQQEN